MGGESQRQTETHFIRDSKPRWGSGAASFSGPFHTAHTEWDRGNADEEEGKQRLPFRVSPAHAQTTDCCLSASVYMNSALLDTVCTWRAHSLDTIGTVAQLYGLILENYWQYDRKKTNPETRPLAPF